MIEEEPMRAVQVARTGGPEVLDVVDLPDPVPGEGCVLVEVAAAGVNFIDTYQRSGLYPVTLPFVPGAEGAGVVVAAGPGVDAPAVGDRVAWCDVPGSYAQRVVVPASRAVPVPAGLGLDVAAALMLQGLTAHYLVNSTHPLAAGERCLVHAGAGGVGLLLIQLAARTGAEVFTTVGSAAKAELARAAGARHVIAYRDEDLVTAVERLAGPRPFDVVYDGVGRDTFAAGLALLRPRGLMVSFGNASGPVDPIPPLLLAQNGSLYLTRPTLGSYIATTSELRERCTELFALVVAGELDVRIGQRFTLGDAAAAHRALEGRGTTGKLLLIP
jgi:NADPH2:quinone reductase